METHLLEAYVNQILAQVQVFVFHLTLVLLVGAKKNVKIISVVLEQVVITKETNAFVIRSLLEILIIFACLVSIISNDLYTL